MRRSTPRALGLIGLLLASACGSEEEPRSIQAYDAAGRPVRELSRPLAPPNLVVIVVDSLRADALQADGEAVRTGSSVPMPWLASFASTGTTCRSATAPAPWTLPSMVSMLTGLHASEHGQYKTHGDWRMASAVTTFAEVLRESYGYDTAAFVNGEWFERSAPSLLQGFSHVRHPFALQVTEPALAGWVASRQHPDRPFLLLLHTMEAHSPYGAPNHPWPPGRMGLPRVDPSLLAPDADPAEIFRRCWLSADTLLGLRLRLGARLPDLLQRYLYRGYAEDPRPDLARELADAYWEGVRWVDDLLADGHATLGRLGLLENTVVVVTSDHGEGFGEHGNLGHGLQVWDEVIQVPLVLAGPPPFDRSLVVDDSIGLVDLFPTFLDWAGMAPVQGVPGRSFLPLLDGESWCRPVISEERLTRANTGEVVDAVRIAARTPSWKYVVDYDLRTGEVREALYDLLVDPDELVDLADGTGRLPEDLVIDPCLCPAVEQVRDRVWGSGARSRKEDAGSIPYGATAAHARTPRPPACEGS